MNFYTYVYRDPSRDMEPFYVGKGTKKRAHHHCGRKDMHPLVQRLQLMKKNGIEPDIEIIHAIDEGHAFFMESCLIEVIGRKDLGKGTLLNLTNGGEGMSGHVPSLEARGKMSASRKGRMHSPETLIKMSVGNKGKTRSPEHRAKIAVSNGERTVSNETRVKMSIAAKTRVKSPEHMAKIAVALRGKTRSPEIRAKMSASHKGKSLSSEHRAKISAAKRKEQQ